MRGVKGDVLLFSHRDFLRTLAVRWLGLDVAEGKHFVLTTASLSALGYEESPAEPVIRLWDQTRNVET